MSTISRWATAYPSDKRRDPYPTRVAFYQERERELDRRLRLGIISVANIKEMEEGGGQKKQKVKQPNAEEVAAIEWDVESNSDLVIDEPIEEAAKDFAVI